MKKISKLLAINKTFMILISIPLTIYLILFAALSFIGILHPIWIVIPIASIAPASSLFTKGLLKSREKLKANISSELAKILRRELYTEFETKNLTCTFNIQLVYITNATCAFDLYYSYTDSALYRSYLGAITKVTNRINNELPYWFDVEVRSKEAKEVASNIIV